MTLRLLLICLCLNLTAAFRLHATEYYSYSLTQSDGLSGMYVRDVVQDRHNGCLWFATLDGLNRYDGYTFTNITTREVMQRGDTPDNRVKRIHPWGKDFLWLKLRGNVFACYHLRARRFVFHTNPVNTNETYDNISLMEGEVWLYDSANGCMRVRLNGEAFTPTKFTTANNALPSPHVNFIRKGSGGNVWIGTAKGLVSVTGDNARTVKGKYDIIATAPTIIKGKKREVFISSAGDILYVADGKLQPMRCLGKLPSGLKVKDAITINGRILLTTKEDVYEFLPQQNRLQRCASITVKDASAIVDNYGNPLLVNDNGDFHFFAANKRQYAGSLPFANSQTKRELNFKAVTTRDSQLLVSTNGQGLFSVDLKGKASRLAEAHQIHTPNDYILSICQDRQGNIWILPEDSGVYCLTPNWSAAAFAAFPAQKATANDDHFQMVRMLRNAKDGNTYAANMGSGLATVSGVELHSMGTPYGSVLSVAFDNGGTPWWGTRQGIFVGDTQYRHDKANALSPSSDKVSDVLCDTKGRMWLACYGGGLDLAVRQKDTWAFRTFFTWSKEVKETRVLCQDHHGMVWLGTGEGIIRFDPDRTALGKKAFRQLLVNKNPKMDEIHAIVEDSKHRVWVTITGTGVALYDNNGRTPRLVRVFTNVDGLGDNSVQSIVEDNRGRIWVGTNNGVSCYNEARQHFNNYSLSNVNLFGNRCLENAACTLPGGLVAFGTKNGMAYFNPDHMVRKPQNTRAGLTSIHINNIPLEQLENEGKANHDGKAFHLDHTHNSIQIRFSDFTFDREHNSQYTYWLEGYDKEWSEPSKMPTAIYKNLPPGTYRFHLRSSYMDNDWSEDSTMVTFVIAPPFWATWYAWLAYFIAAGAIIYFIWRELEDKRRLRERIRVEQQLTDFKMHFFTNISHEFRTPLTVILGAMDSIREKGELPGNLKQPVSTMLKSTRRMKRLIDRLMDFSKTEDGKMQLRVEDTEVVGFTRDIWTMFQQVAQNKRINYHLTTFAKEHHTPIDRKKADTILCNLISNALKYTPTGGEVTVAIEQDSQNGKLLLRVTDTGVGIKEEKQKELFSRFMQSSFSYDSAGIGLYLSGRMATLHHGSITYTARPGGGSIFTLTLPDSATAYTESETAKQEAQPLAVDPQKDEAWLEGYKEATGLSLNDKRVLVVEDDADVTDFVCQELRHYFVVSTACNGKEALDMIAEQRPDLIITDVMMPVMDGYELTGKLKTNDDFYDIPVIMLTALTDDRKRAKGYDAGADDYIAKPFSMKMLVSRCAQLIRQHDRLKATYSTMVSEEPQKVQTIIREERDKKFIDILDNWIMRHLSDSELNIDTLASSLSYGRSTFYAKVNALTGMTPNNYIRKIRLTEAKRLLEEDNITVAEVSYKTGFSNPYYFSRCFKQEFGMPPSTYRKGS